MDERASLGHLLRRFGLGAGKTEVDRYARLGVDGTLSALLNEDPSPEFPNISGWDYMAYEDGTFQLEPAQLSGWWALHMLLTQRPLQHRLALRWHDHFAISGEKVFDAPIVLDYLQSIFRHGLGDFRRMLHTLSRTPALIYYLDLHLSTKFKPNENFARELFELFTLGMGQYTENDIREAARAFTGWSIHYSGIGVETPFDELRQAAARERRSIFAFCEVPGLHDTGEKTLFGSRRSFDGAMVLDTVLEKPECAAFIARQMVSWFVAPKAVGKLPEKAAEILRKNDYSFKPVLRFIAESPEFWAESNVRAIPKSPVDFTATLFRQFGVRDILLQLRGNKAFIPKELKDLSLGMAYLMAQQGLLLLHPPNVGGWEWGNGWVSSTNVTARWNHAQIAFRGDDPNRPITQWIALRLKTEFNASSPETLVSGFLEIFDGAPSPEQRATLVQIAQKHTLKALDVKETASDLFVELGTALFAMPSYHLC